MTADNLHVVETRLILLDGALILSMALSLLSYIKFHQQRYRAFTAAWWMWLAATGFWLACTLGCKMVGLFTFLTVGTAVAWDLWDLMNVKRRSPLTMVRRRRAAQTRSSTDRPLRHLQEQFSKHLFARVGCLILLPFCVYLSFFWIHFKVLKFSGTGDSFMSAAFQETLQGNELLLHAQGPSESERCCTLLRLTDLACTPPPLPAAQSCATTTSSLSSTRTPVFISTRTPSITRSSTTTAASRARVRQRRVLRMLRPGLS